MDKKKTEMPRAKRVLLGNFIKVKAYQFSGMTIRPHLYSAPWRRMYWVCDGKLEILQNLQTEQGRTPSYLYEAVPFPSLKSAVQAIDRATLSKAGAA